MSIKAVEVKNLSFAYNAQRPVLENISFQIEAGETIVFAGLSGCGKTTLCHILTGIIPHAVKGVLTGDISIFGENIRSLGMAQIATRAGLVFQNAENQIICTTLEDELAFGLENLGVEPREIRRRVDETLAAFGFTMLAKQNPATLSGGQKRLLTLAGVLILRPQILILDEPMNALDAEGRALVRQAIADLRSQGRTVVVVEHDLSLVTEADRWLILENGRIAMLDSAQKLLAQPACLQAWGLWL